MYVGLIITITSLVYIIVNASICSIIFSKITNLTRKRSFFGHFLWFSILSTMIIFFLQSIYVSHFCRIQNFVKHTFNLIPPDWQTLHMCPFITHESPEMISMFYCASIVLQYLIVQGYYITPAIATIGMLMLSNFIACLMKYGLLIIFQNNGTY